jgi:hypothetical protein
MSFYVIQTILQRGSEDQLSVDILTAHNYAQDMRQCRHCFTFISMITIIVFITAYVSMFFLQAAALSQSQTTTTVCNGEESSCKTVTCIQGQACYTYQSQPNHVATQQSSDPTIVQQPLNGDSHYPQPLEDDSNSQPVDGEAGTTLAD